MKRTVLFWTISAIVTVSSAIYQRLTGPTYPVAGAQNLSGTGISYRLERSHVVSEDATVRVWAVDTLVQATLYWKRLRTEELLTAVPMTRNGESLEASLPRQPKAGKLEYYVEAVRNDASIIIPPSEPIVIRFKGDVPLIVIILHVLAMFTAMLLSTRTGLECFMAAPRLRRYTTLTMVILAIGGFVLGPIMQWYAFDLWWTGWPFDNDMTDNKTLVAFLGWVVAAVAARRSSKPAPWIIGAALLMLMVYLIPHSAFGTELDYSTMTPTHGR